jgi:glutamine amidotransferase
MTRRIGIVDYGVGNLHSVVNAFWKVGGEPQIVADPNDVWLHDRLLLPGVGAFPAAMSRLRESGLDAVLTEHVAQGNPLMGICLGMQLMCRDSLEDGLHAGLGWVDAHVVPLELREGIKVPHMGWNEITKKKNSPLLANFQDGDDVYFVHSYHARCERVEDVLLECVHGESFVAGFAHDNLYGLQFHPEKSQLIGLSMLANFLTC